jgi:hypothetical protein
MDAAIPALFDESLEVHRAVVKGLLANSRRLHEGLDARFFVLQSGGLTYVVDAGKTTVDDRTDEVKREDSRVMVLDENFQVYGVGFPIGLKEGNMPAGDEPVIGRLDAKDRRVLEDVKPLPRATKGSGDPLFGKRLAILIDRDASGRRGDDLYRIPTDNLHAHISGPIEESAYLSRSIIGSRIDLLDDARRAEDTLEDLMEGRITRAVPKAPAPGKQAPQPREIEGNRLDTLARFRETAERIKRERRNA